jgi:DNA helicase HerA-like ATPase
MTSDFEIGRVVAVDTAQVTIELNADLRGLTRTTYESTEEIGRINSYVILPVGGRRLVAMITRVVLTEEAELNADRTTVSLPSARRLMKATLIGTIDGDSFTQGVAVFPVLDNPVSLVNEGDLSVIFDTGDGSGHPNPDSPGFCVCIGESAIFKGFPIHVDPDALFGKHAAILGSTGSGKSCTITSLLQAVLEDPLVKRTTIVILDTNGEYSTAFPGSENHRTLYIPSDPAAAAERLRVPYWFMNAEDFVRLFQASKGVQRPVLLEALRLARNEGAERGAAAVLREELLRELNRLWSLSGEESKVSKDLRDLAAGLLTYARKPERGDAWQQLTAALPTVDLPTLEAAITTVGTEAAKHIDNGTYPKQIPADARDVIRRAIDPILSALSAGSVADSGGSLEASADRPAFFDKRRFRSQHIEQVLRREESGGARARDYSGTMLLRIDQLLSDRRFDFIFGPEGGQLPDAVHSLATFLRDILGAASVDSADSLLSNTTDVPQGALPFYDRQRKTSPGHDVVILDLSLLASEVLENVTALIGRLILEFLQRLGEVGGSEARGSFPVILVLEEAQNYIREPRFGDEESISRGTFERIAREGRKYGLGLVVASQRPSELSKTVLSQCSSFIVHRLQNPDDLRYFREIVPGLFAPLLDQLPALAPQTALVLGECVRAPALVRIREARPVPRSRDPKFYARWVEESPPALDVESVCDIWERGAASVRDSGADENAATSDMRAERR